MTDPTRRLTPVVRLAPAKLNLTLAVLGRRPDGYHAIHSVIVPLALADRLSVAVLPSGADTLRVEGHPAPAGDLAERVHQFAVRLVVRVRRVVAPAVVHRQARLPGAAGRLRRDELLGGRVEAHQASLCHGRAQEGGDPVAQELQPPALPAGVLACCLIEGYRHVGQDERFGRKVDPNSLLYEREVELDILSQGVPAPAKTLDNRCREAHPCPLETAGKAAVIQKSAEWAAAHEIHGATVDGPFVLGDKFAVVFEFEVTPKATGKRVKDREIGVYTVANGLIVREEFFYGEGAQSLAR